MGYGGARGQRGWAPEAERVTIELRPGTAALQAFTTFQPLLQGGCGAGAYRASLLGGALPLPPQPRSVQGAAVFWGVGPQTWLCGEAGAGPGSRGWGSGSRGGVAGVGAGPGSPPSAPGQPAVRPIPGTLLPPGGEAQPCSLGLTCGTAGAPSSWKARTSGFRGGIWRGGDEGEAAGSSASGHASASVPRQGEGLVTSTSPPGLGSPALHLQS